MQAVVHKQYGPPEVAQLKEMPIPEPGPKEIRIQVFATTVNRTDSGIRSAEYFISRFWSGLFRPKYQTLGCEFAGRVDAIGTEVSTFRIGDRIFGYNDVSFGGHAQYVVVKETDALAIIPENLSFVQAAPLTEGAHYALENIRVAKVIPGQKVMVYGATGAIGSAAVQLLKAQNIWVTAVCNSKNVGLLKKLGADEIIDYQTQDFRTCDKKFDFVFDAVGKTSFGACRHLLNDKGIYISTELGKNGDNVWRGLLAPLIKGKKVLFPIPVTRKKDVEYLAQLAGEGKFLPVIDQIFPLEKIVEAYQYVETGQKTGNVVIEVPSK